MDDLNIKPGTIISGSKWPEPVEVNQVEEFGQYMRIIGATTVSRSHIDQIITKAELSGVLISVNSSPNFSSPSWKVFLSLEAKRYRFASLYDPLLAMSTSKVDPLPHQIDAVYSYVLKLPRIRFLIADDPGAGKTIMAGLIIKELKIRNLASRILIVVPGHLKDQWKRELKERFEESFVVLDRNVVGSFYGENVWERESQIITSMDFAKQEDIIAALNSTTFDLIIVDEAHKMSAYKYGDKTKKTDRYKLGEVLSRISEPHLLFLTATPHKGDAENFRLFMDLLDPGYFATSSMLETSIRDKDNPMFIRRMKEDLKDFDGKPLFLPRNVNTLGFRLSPSEKKLYNDLSKYVKEQYNSALNKGRKRNVAFALVILQRRIASSTFAILKSLERRKDKLEGLLQGPEPKKNNGDLFDFEIVDDLSEEDKWKEEEKWETLSLASSKEELIDEIEVIDGLILQAKSIIRSEDEVKITSLKETLSSLSKEHLEGKVLIFTESKDSLDYLEKKIKAWGFSVTTIHGGMGLDQRIESERIFKNEAQVLVATEAAGEGINLQFCNLMINFDLPWNPNQLEQRMGRIHRYGQKKEVFVYNLIATDTREGKVQKKLFEKLNEIKAALKSDKVFDVVTEVLYGKDLSELMLEAAASARDTEDILRELDSINVDQEYISKVKDNLGESLATKYIDFTRISEMREQAKENKMIPEYTQEFFKRAFDHVGGAIKERKDGLLAIDAIPFEIRSLCNRDAFKKKYGPLVRTYPKITFDKKTAFENGDAELLSFGHPLFEGVMEWVEENLSNDPVNGSTFIDPEGKINAYIFFYEGEVGDGTGKLAGKKLFAYIYDKKSSEIESIAPNILWNFAFCDKPSNFKENTFEDIKEQVVVKVMGSLTQYTKELKEERTRQADIKTKYGLKSLDILKVETDSDLISLRKRKDKGENVDLAIRNKEEQLKKYENAYNTLSSQIIRERELTMNAPKFVGVVNVIPAEVVEEPMVRDDEIEKIGMQIAMKFERDSGRIPEDVSNENLGFDIRSKGPEGTRRYIEVKARAKIGDVAMTQNEWFSAQQLGDDYFLYVVWNASNSSSSELLQIQNPALNLKAAEKFDVVRYIVSPDEIINNGRKL